MGSRKLLNVSEEAYDRLSRLKKKGESFTAVINRLTGNHAILDLVGILSEEAGEEVLGHIREIRDRPTTRMDEMYRRLVE